jgi:hypothetical protein
VVIGGIPVVFGGVGVFSARFLDFPRVFFARGILELVAWETCVATHWGGARAMGCQRRDRLQAPSHFIVAQYVVCVLGVLSVLWLACKGPRAAGIDARVMARAF